MTKINNKATKYDDEMTLALRSAFEHRATWFYLLLNEAKQRGLEWDDFARSAIFKCGCFHGDNKIKPDCEDMDDLTKFIDVFIREETRKVFEADIVENTKDTMNLKFNYCPLVTAWLKLGCSDEEISHLCDIAMDGDRGIAESCGFDITIESKIADGDRCCTVNFDKKG